MTKEHHKATKLITCQHELIDVFMSMLDVEKEEWVKCLINGDFWVVEEGWIIQFYIYAFFLSHLNKGFIRMLDDCGIFVLVK